MRAFFSCRGDYVGVKPARHGPWENAFLVHAHLTPPAHFPLVLMKELPWIGATKRPA